MGHGAGAGCCAVAGATHEFLEVSETVRCGGSSHQMQENELPDQQVKFPSLVTVGDRYW